MHLVEFNSRLSWSDSELMHPPYMSKYLSTHSNLYYFEPHTFLSLTVMTLDSQDYNHIVELKIGPSFWCIFGHKWSTTHGFHKVTIRICQSIEKVLNQLLFLKITMWTLGLEILRPFLWLMKFFSLFLLNLYWFVLGMVRI